MGARNSSKLPSTALTFLAAYVDNVLMVPGLYLEDTFPSRQCVANVCKLNIFGYLLPYFGTNGSNKAIHLFLLVVVFSHQLAFDCLQHAKYSEFPGL